MMKIHSLILIVFCCTGSALAAPAQQIESVSVPPGMVWIPAGPFTAGGDPDVALQECETHNSVCKRKWFADEAPTHGVHLDGFFIDTHEVTQAQFQKVMGENPSGFQGANRPVENVTWYEAQSYCEQVGKRLPTEAEWEKAARGGRDTIYSWGDAVASGKANFCDKNCEKKWREEAFDDGHAESAPVGRFPANGFGLHDMAGNVYEWVADWYDEDYYKNAPAKNPQGPAGGRKKVIRGGSWINYSAGVRPADRSEAKTRDRYNFIGFRCAQ